MSRDQIDFDAIFERHAEYFDYFCMENGDFIRELWPSFGCGCGCEECSLTETTESIINNAFDNLYQFDADLCITDPRACLRAYEKRAKC